MHRKTVSQLTDDQLDALIDKKRKRREKRVREYEAAKEAKRKQQVLKAYQQYEKQCEMFAKELERADKALEKLEKRANNIRALRLQWEDDTQEVLKFALEQEDEQ